MSEFIECKTKFKDADALVAALIMMGWKEGEIEVHKTPQNLYGYQGDKRSQKAEIIIRRKFVGGSSNDMGFAKDKDGCYEAIVSAFDRGSGGLHGSKTHGYNDKWLKELNVNYAEAKVTRDAKRKGYEVKKTVQKGKIILSLYK